MKKILPLIACLFFTLTVKGQIKVTLKNKQTVRARRVEFTKKAVLMNDYDKPESAIFEVAKTDIEEVIFADSTHLKGQGLEEKTSSKDDIARLKATENDSELPFQTGLTERDGRVFIEEVNILKDSTMKKARIFSVAKDWVSRTFKSSKSVIDYEDKEEGKIVCKGIVKEKFKEMLGGHSEITLDFTLDFTFKDGRYRIQLYNLLPTVTHYAFDGSVNKYIEANKKVDIDTFNNEFNAKKETHKRLRKYHLEYIAKVTSMVQPVFKNAMEYISKNTIVSKDKDF
jgi:hypothetical protein